MCVEDRKAMRADQERRAEIIKVLKIRQHFNDFYMRIVDNVAFFNPNQIFRDNCNIQIKGWHNITVKILIVI